ncbi:prepilin peptidase [Anaerocolumna cellulosilytica]|nr:A24 family peptidase [Anaerocolumna cellulosilytica]MBB5194596.1 leader peptidase (prepilin peptidase)/N-methyltransferase [Anaerocolumna cellulosilytica]
MVIFIYFVTMIYASITDCRNRIVQDRVHVIILVLALLHDINVRKVLGAFLLTTPFLVYAVMKNHMGGGDIKFIFANTVFLGLQRGYVGLILGFLVVIIYSLCCKLFFNKDIKIIPLIPFITIGYIISLSITK